MTSQPGSAQGTRDPRTPLSGPSQCRQDPAAVRSHGIWFRRQARPDFLPSSTVPESSIQPSRPYSSLNCSDAPKSATYTEMRRFPDADLNALHLFAFCHAARNLTRNLPQQIHGHRPRGTRCYGQFGFRWCARLPYRSLSVRPVNRTSCASAPACDGSGLRYSCADKWSGRRVNSRAIVPTTLMPGGGHSARRLTL
jgi:hypothetical protein